MFLRNVNIHLPEFKVQYAVLTFMLEVIYTVKEEVKCSPKCWYPLHRLRSGGTLRLASRYKCLLPMTEIESHVPRTVSTHFDTRGAQLDELREPQFRRKITQDLRLSSSQVYGVATLFTAEQHAASVFCKLTRNRCLIENPLYFGRG